MPTSARTNGETAPALNEEVSDALAPIQKIAEALPIDPEAEATVDRLVESKFAGPVRKLISQAEQDANEEKRLNAGVDSSTVVNSKLCELVDLSESEQTAFQTLRRGYPHLSMSEQCQGHEFRENADLVTAAIAKQTLALAPASKMVVVMPWRSALAFGKAYQPYGIKGYFHVSARRNHETLLTEADYQSGQIDLNDIVIMADPMLATGNTAIDSIERVIAMGISPDNIIVNALVAAPVGIKTIKDRYPSVRVIVAALDEKLDHRGYIVPGLGDFGDKYFADFSPTDFTEMTSAMKIDKQSCQKLAERFNISPT
ncbi:hypothetical protein IT412_02335 [Candidatus Peregrinibacteria bacterium]|nr:hypothetical protein [Candidatus Peregrinibacteria bacterium]